MSKKRFRKPTNYEAYRDSQLKNPKFKKYYDEFGKQLEIAYKINTLRRTNKISQASFAKKLGTTQSNVARMEAGNQNFTTNTLQKIAKIFKKDLKIEFV